MRTGAIAAALLLPALAAHAQPMAPAYQAGQVFEITRDNERSQATAQGSTGSSRDRDTIVERVISADPTGLTVEYDLPPQVSAEDRARQWIFPVRILRPAQGPLQLLDRPELEARVAAWLRAAGLKPAACGQWYFTWNAFQVDCDPQSAIRTVEGFDPDLGELRDGAPYQDPKAIGPVPLKRTSASPAGAVFTVEAAIDPDVVRRDHAQADFVVAQIMRKPLTLEAALSARSADSVSGTISTTFETDPAGRVRRRTRVTRLTLKGADGQVETDIETETLERRLASRPGG